MQVVPRSQPIERERTGSFMSRKRVITHFFAELLRKYVGHGRRISIAECSRQTGYAERSISAWLKGESEPNHNSLKCLATVLGDDFVLDLVRAWGFAVRRDEPVDEMTREIGALLASNGYRVVKRSRAA